MFKVSFFSFVTFLIILFPLLPDYAGLGLEYVLLFVVLCLLSIYNITKESKVVLSALSFCGLFLVLTLLSLAQTVNESIPRDFFELIKPVYFFSVFVFSSNLIKSHVDINKAVKTLVLMFVFMSFFGLLESISQLVNDVSALLYKGIRQPVQNKAVFSFISPYTFASILVIPVFYYLLKVIFDEGRLMSFVLFVVSFLSLILTQSKTVALGFLITLVLFVLLLLSRKWLPNYFKLVSTTMVVLMVVMMLLPFILSYAETNLRYLYYGFNVVYNAFESNYFLDVIYSTPSISNRYEQMLEVVAFQSSLPIFGAGIIKSFIYPESFYALYLLRYGILGIVVHLYFVCYLFYSSIKMARYFSKDNISLMCFFLSITAYSISLPFSYFSSAVNDQVRSGYIFYVLLGVCFSCMSIYKKRAL